MQTNPSAPNLAASCTSGSTWDLGSTWWLSPFLRVLCISPSHLLRLSVTQTSWNPSCTPLCHVALRAGWCRGRELCCPFWCEVWPFGISSPGCVLSQAPVQGSSWWNGVSSKKSLGSVLCRNENIPVSPTLFLALILNTVLCQLPWQKSNPLPPQTSTLGVFLPQKIPSRWTLA